MNWEDIPAVKAAFRLKRFDPAIFPVFRGSGSQGCYPRLLAVNSPACPRHHSTAFGVVSELREVTQKLQLRNGKMKK